MQRDGAISRRQIHIRGIVQGVGFRPFVFNLAQGLGLNAYVLNSSAGLTIEVEGESGELDRFVGRLGDEAPPLSHIEEVAVTRLERVTTVLSFATAWMSPAGWFPFRRIFPPATTAYPWRRFPGSRKSRMSVHQLHQLRPALYHHAQDSVRSPADHHGLLCHVRAMSRGV